MVLRNGHLAKWIARPVSWVSFLRVDSSRFGATVQYEWILFIVRCLGFSTDPSCGRLQVNRFLSSRTLVLDIISASVSLYLSSTADTFRHLSMETRWMNFTHFLHAVGLGSGIRFSSYSSGRCRVSGLLAWHQQWHGKSWRRFALSLPTGLAVHNRAVLSRLRLPPTTYPFPGVLAHGVPCVKCTQQRGAASARDALASPRAQKDHMHSMQFSILACSP